MSLEFLNTILIIVIFASALLHLWEAWKMKRVAEAIEFLTPNLTKDTSMLDRLEYVLKYGTYGELSDSKKQQYEKEIKELGFWLERRNGELEFSKQQFNAINKELSRAMEVNALLHSAFNHSPLYGSVSNDVFRLQLSTDLQRLKSEIRVLKDEKEKLINEK